MSPKREAQCTHCGKVFLRKNTEITRARRNGRGLYCSRVCICKEIYVNDDNKLGHIIKRLASRACGTNSREFMREANLTSIQCALDALNRRVERHGYTRVDGKGTPDGHISHQYFAISEHARAWAMMPPMKRPNAVIRQNKAKFKPLKPIQSSTWARLPMTGGIAKSPPVQAMPVSGLAAGFDKRTQMSPEGAMAFIGIFGSLGPGRYLED